MVQFLAKTIGEIEGRCKFLLNLPIRNIAQNQSFVQKGIGVKYKNSDSSPTQ